MTLVNLAWEKTPLVNRKLETLYWEKNSATGTPYLHSGRCLNKNWGCTVREFRHGKW